ncbi:MAG: pilus assembly protein, partial [Gammaproteobacteria bacterium]
AWRQLNTSATSPLHVECQADQGVHGDGTGGTWIRNGTSSPWQSSSGGAANWSSTGNTYTIFSANYLNWFHFHSTTVVGTRIQIMKDVVKSVVDSNTNINIGLMRYDTKDHNSSSTGPSENKGGPVIFPMSDIDAAGVRTSFKTAVDGLTASGYTPLSETLYEAYRYVAGQDVFFGKPPNNISSSGGCLDPANTSKYKSPMEFECQKNFIVYLTDGEPTYDGDADSPIGTLLSGATLPSGDVSCAHGPLYDPVDNCLDELAEYLHDTDLRSDLNGKQNAVSYMIGFTLDFPLLKDAATKGGGEYFTANTSQELSSAFTQIVTEIRKISDLFSAPAVSVNAFNQLYHNNDLYFALFQPAENIHWPGNVKRFEIGPYDSDGNGTKDRYAILDANDKLAVDPNTGFFAETATSFWTPAADAPDGGEPELGGSVSKQPDDPDTRKVFTYTGDYSASAVKDLSQPVNQLHESNLSITEAMLGLLAPDPQKTDLLKWARGVDVDDEDADSVTAEARKVMGDPLHASPVLVSYGLSGTGAEDMTLFVTSNDGYLHAVDTDDGTELFSFVPKEMLARLKTLRADPPLNASGREYGLDGPMTVWIKENAAAADPDSNIEPGEGDHVYLYFGERRGGRNYYAVDVTNRDAPELLWKIEGGVIGDDFEELGETWSA